jgi:hypothetical protein
MSEETDGTETARGVGTADVRNAADPEQVKAARKRGQRRKAREIDDMALVLQTAPGRRVMWRIMGYCGIYRSSTEAGGIESHPQMAYHEGRQDVGRFIFATIGQVSPTAYHEMQQEAANQTD